MIKWILVGVGLILVAVIAFVGLRHHEGATRMQELQALEYYSEIEEHFVEPCIREVLARSGITKGNAPEEFKEKWLNDPGAQQGIKGLDAMVSGLSLEARMAGYATATAACIESAMEVVNSEMKKQ